MILAVDSGTTRTRAWVVSNGAVAHGASAVAGARDLARSRDRNWLLERVREVADAALSASQATWDDVDAVVAFGMITSEHGLEELPHLVAPVGAPELSAAMHERAGLHGLPAPLFLVPGVRNDGGTVDQADFMRGEETEVIGLLSLGRVAPPLLYVSIGSHPKLVRIDAAGRIAGSLTTLSGELIWALHRETILADLVDPERSIHDLEAVDYGARVAEAAGLGRALFSARLLNRVEGAPPEQCSAFVHGAIARSDLLALEAAPARERASVERIAVSGAGPLLDAYCHLLRRAPWVGELHVISEPLGPLGAALLYAARNGAGNDEQGRPLRA